MWGISVTASWLMLRRSAVGSATRRVFPRALWSRDSYRGAIGSSSGVLRVLKWGDYGKPTVCVTFAIIVTTNLSTTLCYWLWTGHTAHSRRGLEALTFHHAAQNCNKLGGILKLAIVHCFLCAIHIFDGMACDTSRSAMVMYAVP